MYARVVIYTFDEDKDALEAKAREGAAIVLCHRTDDGSIVHIRAAVAGRDGVKVDTWYTLGADGEFVEVQS
jgi:hypothetical protein